MYYTGLYEWEEVSTTTKCPGQTPPCIYDHSAVIVESNGEEGPRMIVFGGDINSTIYGDLYVLNLDTGVWTKPRMTGEVPTSRRGHSANMISENMMLVYGGTRHSSPSSEVFIMNTDNYTWRQQQCRTEGAKQPCGRLLHTATSVPYLNSILVHGGWNPDAGGRLSDSWLLDIRKFEWKHVQTHNTPAGRYRHSAVLQNKKLFVFGGWIDTGRSNDIWSMDLDKRDWIKIKVIGPSPEIRTGQDMVFISGKDIFMFGGYNEKRNNDSWIFNANSSEWKYVDVRGRRVEGRFGHTLTYSEGKIFLFGGKGDNSVYSLRVGEPSSYHGDMCRMFNTSHKFELI